MEHGLSQPGSLTFILKTHCPQCFSLHMCFQGGRNFSFELVHLFCSLIALVFASSFSCKTVSKQDLGGSPPQSRMDQDRKDIYQGSVLWHFPSSVLRRPRATVSSCVGATCLKAMPVSGLLSSSLMGLEWASPRRRLKMRVTTVRAGAGMQSPPTEGPCAVSPPPPFPPALGPWERTPGDCPSRLLASSWLGQWEATAGTVGGRREHLSLGGL